MTIVESFTGSPAAILVVFFIPVQVTMLIGVGDGDTVADVTGAGIVPLEHVTAEVLFNNVFRFSERERGIFPGKTYPIVIVLITVGAFTVPITFIKHVPLGSELGRYTSNPSNACTLDQLLIAVGVILIIVGVAEGVALAVAVTAWGKTEKESVCIFVHQGIVLTDWRLDADGNAVATAPEGGLDKILLQDERSIIPKNIHMDRR